MTVKELCQKNGYEVLCMPDPDREVTGGYAGDLLSWVMTRLQPDNAWVTIMNNLNVIAVASLADAACVILSENAEVEDAVIAKAEEQGVNLLRSARSSYEVCLLLGSANV